MTNQTESPLAESSPAGHRTEGSSSANGSAAGVVLSDGTQILHDQSTTTTRWVLYRHHQTNKLNLAIEQGREKVTVSINNLRHMLEVVVPQRRHERRRWRKT